MNKNIVISGGSSGIGLELVKQLASEGNNLYSFDIQVFPETIERVTSITADISDWSQIKKGMESVQGTIDILINNAGIMHRGEFFQTTQEEWDRLIGVHLTGSYGMIREAYEHLSPQPMIVQVSSGHAKHPKKDPFAYSLMKQAGMALASDLSVHYPQYTVKSVFPGPVETPLAFTELSEEQIAAKRQKGMHTPKYVASLIIQLMNSSHRELVFNREKWDYDFV